MKAFLKINLAKADRKKILAREHCLVLALVYRKKSPKIHSHRPRIQSLNKTERSCVVKFIIRKSYIQTEIYIISHIHIM